MLRVSLAVMAAVMAAGASAAQVIPAREVLPDTVVPLHYELAMHPDQQALTYTAEVAVDIEAKTAVPAIVLNARDMTFTDVRLEDGRAGQAAFDPKLERATLTFPGGVTAGRHRLSIAYRGSLRRDTYGFFAMDYATPNGPKRMLATNTEPAAERSFVPSWDEPAQKATFTVSIDAPAGQSAYGNMPIAKETPLPGGGKRVQFATTPKMSTYLLFFTVGDYERISQKVDGVDFGVVVQRGQAERGRYALAEGVRLLRFYNDYFGVKFPLPKLDLIAAPGTIKGSSMENWGANFYGQADLLFDPKTSSESDRQHVFLVVAHEMAHQWFGDLVTMAWWDNLWLNEGFARWMQTHAAVALHPEWKTGLQALAIHERGMNLDASAATHPVEQPVASTDDAVTAFDNITYDKGAAVIRMLEEYVGSDRFRDGVRRYMAAHAYGNTRSDDLWSALQAASGKPVQDIALAFTRRSGLPLIVVTTEETRAGRRVSFVQDAFLSDHRAGQRTEPVASWPIPLTVKPLEEPARTILLTERMGEFQAARSAPILLNFGRTSYARVLYTQPLFTAVAQRMKDIPAADQIGLIYDSWALGRAEYAPLTDTLRLIDGLPVEADPLVWNPAIDEMEAFDRAIDGLPEQLAYRRWAQGRLAPLAARVGWRSKAGEPAAVALLREPLFGLLGRFGDAAVLAEARRIERAPKGTERGDLVSLARRIIGASANSAEFDRLAGELKTAPDALTRQDILFAMAEASDPKLAQRALDIATGPDAPTGSIQSVAGIVGANHPSLVWRYLMAHLDDPSFAVDPVTRVRMASNMVGRSADPADAAALREAARTRFPPSSARNVAGALANNDLNARVRARAAREFAQWLASAR